MPEKGKVWWFCVWEKVQIRSSPARCSGQTDAKLVGRVRQRGTLEMQGRGTWSLWAKHARAITSDAILNTPEATCILPLWMLFIITCMAGPWFLLK